MALKEGATITDIVSKLSRAEDYLRGVFGNMADFRKEYGAAVVRIGLTGRGAAPHYRIQASVNIATERMASLDATEKEEDQFFQAFHGRSHERLDLGSSELRTEHWSMQGMQFEEVRNLLGQLRGFQPRTINPQSD